MQNFKQNKTGKRELLSSLRFGIRKRFALHKNIYSIVADSFRRICLFLCKNLKLCYHLL